MSGEMIVVSEPWYRYETDHFLGAMAAGRLGDDPNCEDDPYLSLLEDRATPPELPLVGYPHPGTKPYVVEIGLSDRTLHAGVYQPLASKERPILLWLHGGGFIGGSYRDIEWVASRLAVYGDVIVVSLDYRLAPEHPYPAALFDVVETLDWLSVHADELAGSPTLAVGGQSAGAALAAGACLMLRDEKDLGRQVAAQVLAYPCLDLGQQTESVRAFDGVFHSVAPGSWADAVYFPAGDPGSYALPLRSESLADLPHSLVIGAGMDPLRDDARNLHHRLLQDGSHSTLIEYEGVMHAFLNFPMAFTCADDAVARAGKFLRQHLPH